jgi:hypothetical protein
VDLERARPAIEQYLLSERKRELVNKEVKDLRAAAKIEYVGKFAEAAQRGTDVASGASAPEANISPKAAAASAGSAGSSPAELDASTINRGMGIK